MTAIPVLKTERLILRPHEPEDLPAFHAMRSDPRVIPFVGDALTRSQAWGRLCGYRGMWHFTGYSYWAVADRETNAFLGEAGFADFKRDVEPTLEGLPEAGWIMSADAFGKGYATEAMICALDWLDRTLPGQEAVCMIAPENVPSLRVAEKCGFVRWTETVFMDHDVILFRRPSGNVRHREGAASRQTPPTPRSAT